MSALAARTDAIIAGRNPAPARSLTVPLRCRDCIRNEVRPVGFDVIETGRDGAVSRAYVACVRCGRRWTVTVTLAPTKDHLIELHNQQMGAAGFPNEDAGEGAAA